MSNKNNTCLNCPKIGCHGVNYRAVPQKEHYLSPMEPACQWCNASLRVINKRTWIEYIGMLLLLAPLVTYGFFPDLPTYISIIMLAIPLLMIVFGRLGVSYEFAHERNKASVSSIEHKPQITNVPTNHQKGMSPSR